MKNVFYHSFGSIYDYVQQNIFDDEEIDNSIINIGFWPGGDRDGNPFVTPEITLNVARKLKESTIKNYIKDVKYLRRRLTFRGIRERIIDLNHRLHYTLLDIKKDQQISLSDMREELKTIRTFPPRRDQFVLGSLFWSVSDLN